MSWNCRVIVSVKCANYTSNECLCLFLKNIFKFEFEIYISYKLAKFVLYRNMTLTWSMKCQLIIYFKLDLLFNEILNSRNIYNTYNIYMFADVSNNWTWTKTISTSKLYANSANGRVWLRCKRCALKVYFDYCAVPRSETQLTDYDIVITLVKQCPI